MRNLPSKSTKVCAISLALFLLAPIQSLFAVSDYEPFADATASGGSAYTVGSVLCSGFNGTVGAQTNATGGVWLCISNEPGVATIGQPTIASGNLAYPGLSASPGNSLGIPGTYGNMGRMKLPFAPVTSGQVFYSLRVQATSISALTTSPTANFFVALGDSTGAQQAAVARAEAQVVAKASGGGYVLGVSLSPPKTTTNYVYDTTVHNVNDVLFIVADYDFTTGYANLWINPPTNSFGAATPPAPTVTGTTGTAPNGGQIQSIMLGCFTSTQAAAWLVDDLRVATNWAVATGAPDLQTQPAALATNAGTTATFSVTATGNAPLSYQWMNSAGNLTNGGQIAGSGTSALSISNCTANNNDNYSVIVSNNYGATTSSLASLTVSDPYVNIPPSNQTLPPLATAVFTVVASGVPSLTYGWYKDGSLLSDGGNIAGAHTARLTVSAISFADAGNYSIEVTNGLGATVLSAPAQLSITDPAIIDNPESVTNNYGTTVHFTVTAEGQSALTYQWQQSGVGTLTNGGGISGSSTSNLTIMVVSYTNAGFYSVIVTDTNGSAQSATAQLTVIEPIITNQPISLTNAQGSTAMFTVAAIGAAPVSYRWSKNGVAYSSDAGNISGSQTATLSVSGVTAADDGTYSVVVSDASGQSAQSTNVVLTVLTAPSIISGPAPLTITPGNTATFAVAASGAAPLNFLWYSNSVLVSTTTNSFYQLPSVQLGMAGGFSVIVTNSIGAVTSSVVALGVVPSIHLYNTNLVVVRLGNGAQSPNYSGNSIFLDQITTSGAYLNTVCIPDSGPSALIGVGPMDSGTTLTGTELSLSADGQNLVVAGYNTPVPYSAALQVSTASQVPRGIGLINANGQFRLAVSDTNSFSGTFFRGAASDGMNNFWGVGGAQGTFYYAGGGPGVLIESQQPNLRTINIFNGNLYAVGEQSAGSGSREVLGWTGLPTAPANPTDLFTPTQPGDLAIDDTGTNMYVSTTAGPDYYQWNGGTWIYEYTLSANFVGLLYMTVDFSQPHPVIYGTTYGSSYNSIATVTDNSGTTAAGAILYTAGPNETLFGVRFGPSEPPIISISVDNNNNAILTWSGSFILQSATNVAGPYTDVPSATSPYTNSLGSAQRLFFRTRN